MSCLPTLHWDSGYGPKICWMPNNSWWGFQKFLRVLIKAHREQQLEAIIFNAGWCPAYHHTTVVPWESTWTPLPHVWFKLCFGLIWAVTWCVGEGPKIMEDSSALERLKHMGIPYAGQEFGPQTRVSLKTQNVSDRAPNGGYAVSICGGPPKFFFFRFLSQFLTVSATLLCFGPYSR